MKCATCGYHAEDGFFKGVFCLDCVGRWPYDPDYSFMHRPKGVQLLYTGPSGSAFTHRHWYPVKRVAFDIMHMIDNDGDVHNVTIDYVRERFADTALDENPLRPGQHDPRD